ncbi:MAG: prepilin-type N-terminal cleavage/methylation domain-containing protein [Planctomycetia bacterium]|nr:prepilin-type N-terminal cleavage/methylation domain-containing protein [Planctomycetia bacterium]
MCVRSFFSFNRGGRRRGYTLIEILMATSLSLILLMSAVRIFLMMNEGFGTARHLMSMTGQARNAQQLLQKDLSHYMTCMRPPRPVEAQDGYFVCGKFPLTYGNVPLNYIFVNEKSIWRNDNLQDPRVDPNLFNNSKEGLIDKVNYYVALTVCNHEEPFRFNDSNGNAYETPYAEVAWFVYKSNLCRIIVPVVEAFDRDESRMFLSNSSKMSEAVNFPTVPFLSTSPTDGLPLFRKINLGLLSDPRNRLITAYKNAERKTPTMIYSEFLRPGSNVLHHDVPFLWGWMGMRLDPTTGNTPLGSETEQARIKSLLDNWLVLPNVIQFEIQAWDPSTNRYIDLENLSASNYYRFNSNLETGSGRQDLRTCYDTWSTQMCASYYNPSSNVEYTAPRGLNGYVGAQESMGNFLTTNYRSIGPPPYSAPLPGIRIIVRNFDPDSGQVKEFRVVQDFRTY